MSSSGRKRKLSDGLDENNDENDSNYDPDTDIDINLNNVNACNTNSNSNTKQRAVDVIRAGSGWEYFITEFKAPLQIDDQFHWSSLSYYGDCVVYKLEKLEKSKIVKVSSNKANSINVDIAVSFRQTTTNRLKGEKKSKTKDNNKRDVAGNMQRCFAYYSCEFGIVCPWRLIPIEGTSSDIRNRLISARSISDPQNLPILQQMMQQNKKV